MFTHTIVIMSLNIDVVNFSLTVVTVSMNV